MSRLLLNAFLFLLPFMLYGLYVLAARRLGWMSRDADQAPPHAWLVLTGLGLVLASIGLFAVFDGSEVGKEYVPARLENGEIVPGGFR